MRQLFAFEMITLDGFYEGPNQELDWPNADDEFNRFAINQLNEIDTLLFGRVTYELMASYWPTEAAAADDPVIAGLMNSVPKVVFSRTLDHADWNNTTLVKGDAADHVARLKKQSGKSLATFGSLNLTNSLIRCGLVDELRIMVNPVALGSGNSLFKDMKDRLKLKLLRTTTFSSGNVLLCYQPLLNQ
jgi:dihydrofolate reductase